MDVHTFYRLYYSVDLTLLNGFFCIGWDVTDISGLWFRAREREEGKESEGGGKDDGNGEKREGNGEESEGEEENERDVEGKGEEEEAKERGDREEARKEKK